MCCLRRYGALTASADFITTTASTPMAPFLVPPKLSTSAHEAISATEHPEMRGGVREPSAVEVDAQVVRVAELLDRAQLGEGVAGAELGGLGNRDDARLGEVLVATAGQAAGDEVGGDLAVR